MSLGFNSRILTSLGAMVVIMALLTSCGSTKKTVVTDNISPSNKSVETSTPPQKSSQEIVVYVDDTVAEALIAEGRKWLGVPYKYGGNDMSGVDCSGLVLQIYKTVTDISLPRNSAQQCDYCKKIEKDMLSKGDLVFFSSRNSANKVAHVGMYIGDGIMLHASSSNGVIETPLSDNYYVNHFLCAGRIPAFYNSESVKIKETFEPSLNGENKKDEEKSPEEIIKNAFKNK